MGESDAPAASCDFASMLVPILVFNRLDPCRLPCRNAKVIDDRGNNPPALPKRARSRKLGQKLGRAGF